LQSVNILYVTSAKNVHLLGKTSLLLHISSLHVVVSVLNGESFLLNSPDCHVKGSDLKSIILHGIKRAKKKNEAAYQERNFPIEIHALF